MSTQALYSAVPRCRTRKCGSTREMSMPRMTRVRLDADPWRILRLSRPGMKCELDPPYQRRRDVSTNLQFAGAFHIPHTGKCAQTCDNSIQMGDVLRLDDELDDRLAILA